MTRLLHIASSPRGAASASLQIADAFLDPYRLAHPEAEIETWDLWDGSLPAFGPAAAGAKMTVFGAARRKANRPTPGRPHGVPSRGSTAPTGCCSACRWRSPTR